MKIEGITPEMEDSLCRKWKRPETVIEVQDVEVPDPKKKGKTIKVPQKVSVPNPQSKQAFVDEYMMNFALNEYRLQELEDEKVLTQKKVETKVKKVKLTASH